MSNDEVKRADLNRDSRLRDMQKESPKARPAETEFDKILERSKLPQQLLPQSQQGMKTVTEEAIREAMRHQERDQEGRRDDDGKKENRDQRQKNEGQEARVGDQRVVAKGKLKQGSGGAGGGREGYGGASGKRELTKTLVRHGAKSLPVDLSSKFAGRLARAMKGTQAEHTAMTQEVLTRLVQYVRVGLNRKGEKEIQLDLHEKIFRGLKLRVTARGGKVSIHFRTADVRGRKAFEENEGAIRDALAKKGIEVDDIQIS